ncbi:papain inhibitor-like [Paramacrobiotus metropolitanus]|uniref:papain inhibitor-like n=1 Tax=Paramacrobiotus metropolitanus TaxID=2943436 RepID=UPI0024461E54|nr:papain inhibitor-like [Paramacrobiotus metropolitanus]
MAAQFFLSLLAIFGLCAVALGFQGKATFYTPSTKAKGACGKFNTAKDMVVAISQAQYGKHSNPNNAPVCSKCALVKAAGKQVKVRVVDVCWGCASGSIDLSPVAFEKLASKDLGHIQVTWNYVKC